jgi:hypothetical protein
MACRCTQRCLGPNGPGQFAFERCSHQFNATIFLRPNRLARAVRLQRARRLGRSTFRPARSKDLVPQGALLPIASIVRRGLEVHDSLAPDVSFAGTIPLRRLVWFGLSEVRFKPTEA